MRRSTHTSPQPNGSTMPPPGYTEDDYDLDDALEEVDVDEDERTPPYPYANRSERSSRVGSTTGRMPPGEYTVDDDGFAQEEEEESQSQDPRVDMYRIRNDGSVQEVSTNSRSVQERIARDEQLIRSSSHRQEPLPPRSRFTPPPIDMYDEKAEEDRKRRNRLLCVTGLIVLLILGLAVGVGLALGLKNSNESKSSDINTQSTDNPPRFTPRPTRAPTFRPPTFNYNTIELNEPRDDVYDACDLISVLQKGTADRCRSLCATAIRCCNDDRQCKTDNEDRCDEYFGPCVALEVVGD